MKALILTDDYLPGSTRNHAKMMHELGLELVSLGHDVYVLTPDESLQSSRLVFDNFQGVNVWRFKTAKFRDVGLFKRGVGELLLSFRACLALRKLKKVPDFDICINYSPSIFLSPVAAYFRFKKVFVYLVLRDFFPQWLVDEGIIAKYSPLLLLFRLFERLNYRVSNVIGLQSPANIPVFSKVYHDPQKLKVLLNWAVNDPGYLVPSVNIKKELGLEEKIIYFYGGNIGHAQDMKNLTKLAKDMIDYNDAHFLFVGQGDEYGLVQDYATRNNLKNLTILPSVDQEKYKSILRSVDVGLLSLSPNHTAHNFPGKILGYMAASLPILGSVNMGNDLIEIVNFSGAGFVSVNGNRNQLKVDAVTLLDEKVRRKMGVSSNKLLEEKFSVKHAASEILEQYFEWKVS